MKGHTMDFCPAWYEEKRPPLRPVSDADADRSMELLGGVLLAVAVVAFAGIAGLLVVTWRML